MARPIKDTVDYFPHFCDHGKTMFIIEQHYGNDGYAFWFKLLELLGKTEGHFYDCNNPDDWEFLQAKTKFLEVKCNEILNKLALLGAIDKSLWEEKRIIWSDNFISNVADAYKNRKRPIPKKPFLQIETTVSNDSDIVSTSKTPVSTPNNPHSRVEESIENNNKTNQNHNAYTREEFLSVEKSTRDGLDGRSKVGNLYPSGNAAEETAATKSTGGDRPALELSADNNPDFMGFWSNYPRRSGMTKAMEAWKITIAKGIPAKYLIIAAGKYAAYVKAQQTEEKFIKMPHTFLLERVFCSYLPKNMPECPRCHGEGSYQADDGVAICDCRKVLITRNFLGNIG